MQLNNKILDCVDHSYIIDNLNKHKLAYKIQQKYDFDLGNFFFNYIDTIINIFQHENFDNLNREDSNILYLIGFYHKIKKNFILAKKYLKLSAENENIYALNELGKYYRDNEKNILLMMKYLMKAIKLENSNAMVSLANYYYNNKNFSQTKRFLLLAVKYNNSISMFNLAKYYLDIRSDPTNALKYFKMATELNNKFAMCELANYYCDNLQYDLAIKYYMKAIELNDIKSMYNLGLYYQTIDINFTLMKNYYIMCIKSIQEINSHSYDDILSSVYNNISCFYTKNKQYDMAERYLISSANLLNSNAMMNLYHFYNQFKPNDNLATKYLYELINFNVMEGLNKLEDKFLFKYSPYEFYLELLNIQKKSIIPIQCVEERIKIYNNINEIKIFKKKYLSQMSNRSNI